MEELDEKQLVKRTVNATNLMVQNCPNPTQAELRKLLAIQGHLLNTIGLDILLEFHGKKKNDIKLNTALKALAVSREALKAAANIEI